MAGEDEYEQLMTQYVGMPVQNYSYFQIISPVAPPH
jgi:hypothetical protein